MSTEQETALEQPTVRTGPTSSNVSVPAFEQNLTLNTLQAQKVMTRSFSRTAGSLYRIDVILRIIGGEESAERMEMVISTAIREVETELQNAQKQMSDLLEDNGVDQLPVYDTPTTESVRITSPHVSRFVGLVRKLDRLVSSIDALWLSGLMSNKEHSDALYTWQQKVIGLGSRIIGMERRAREAARNQGKSEEVAQNLPELNDETVDEGAENAA